MKLNVKNPIEKKLTQKDYANSGKQILRHDLHIYLSLIIITPY